MSLKINPIVAVCLLAGILILMFSVFKGCKKSRIEVAARAKAEQIADSALRVVAEYKGIADSTAREFQDTIEFERGQKVLIENQKAKAEAALDVALAENKELIAKHRLAQYTDTTATVVPAEYVQDCENCFSKLESSTNLTLRYKGDLNNLQIKWDRQDQLYQKRFKQLEAEKLGFYNKVNTLAKEQKEVVDKLKPHGKLYLSWSVLWAPWPIAGGAGLMYQTKYSFQYGVKVYYGNNGSIFETSMHFPLSIRFK